MNKGSTPAGHVAPKTPIWRRKWVLGAAGLLVAAGIGSQINGEAGQEAAAPVDTPASTGTEAPSKSPERPSQAPKSDECEAVPPAVLTMIQKRFTSTVDFKRAGAWRSPDYENVTFVAQEFETSGAGTHVAVFAVGGMTDADGPSGILGVDGFAHQFTDYYHSDTSKWEISTADPGVDKAKGCIR